MPENNLADALDRAQATLDGWAAARSRLATEPRPGWQPPVIYDVAIDAYRAATQADIDNLVDSVQRLNAVYQDILESFRKNGINR